MKNRPLRGIERYALEARTFSSAEATESCFRAST